MTSVALCVRHNILTLIPFSVSELGMKVSWLKVCASSFRQSFLTVRFFLLFIIQEAAATRSHRLIRNVNMGRKQLLSCGRFPNEGW